MSNGNIFVFSFSREGWEAIVNLTEIDEQNIMDKMSDTSPKRTVAEILTMMKTRAQFNQDRGMEVWLVKLDESFTEEGLLEWAEEDPQAVADLARMGEPVYSNYKTRIKDVIN